MYSCFSCSSVSSSGISVSVGRSRIKNDNNADDSTTNNNNADDITTNSNNADDSFTNNNNDDNSSSSRNHSSNCDSSRCQDVTIKRADMFIVMNCP